MIQKLSHSQGITQMTTPMTNKKTIGLPQSRRRLNFTEHYENNSKKQNKALQIRPYFNMYSNINLKDISLYPKTKNSNPTVQL